MTQSRRSQVSLSDTPYYHCISRCVRRAYLCGEDKYTEKSFEHRRQWVVERMHYLASLFNEFVERPCKLVIEKWVQAKSKLMIQMLMIHWSQIWT